MISENICPNPQCGAVLKFDRTAGDWVTCPFCKQRRKVADFREKEPPTAVPDNSSIEKMYKPGILEMTESDARWLQKERTLELKTGVNTLGRMSPTSTASIQLPTTDEFMGRNHATIEVNMKANGIFEHRLSDNGSKNGTFHNGKRLEKEDVILLVPDDSIKLGHTVFKLRVES